MGGDLGECITRMQLQQVADGFEASNEAARGVALQGKRRVGWEVENNDGRGDGLSHLREVVKKSETRCEHIAALQTPGLHGSQDTRHGEGKDGRSVGYVRFLI